MSPVIVHFGFAERDSAVTRTIHVRNRGSRTLRVRFYQRDFRQGPEGQHSFEEAGATNRSCADRTRVLPSQARIEAGGQASIQVRMEPVSETCWGVVFAEQVRSASGRVTVTQRVGTKIYGLPPGHGPPGGSMASVRPSLSGDSLRVEMRVENTGAVPLRPEGRIELRAVDGAVRGRHGITPFSVLPGHGRSVRRSVPVSDLPAGDYLVVPVLALDDGSLIGGQGRITIEAEGASDSAGGGG